LATYLEPTVEDLMPMSTHPSEKVLAAPEELGLDSRTAFRRAATELLEQLGEGAGRSVPPGNAGSCGARPTAAVSGGVKVCPRRD